MQRTLVATSLLCLLATANSAVAQQTPAVPASPAINPVAPSSPASASPEKPVSSTLNLDPTPAPATVPTPNTLTDGTAVKLRLAENLSSAESKTGQQVPFEVVEDVVVNGITIIPKGTQALATVTDAQAKRRLGRGGKLDVNIDSTRLVDDEKVQLRGIKDTRAGGHVGLMTTGIVATGILFFPVAPLFLLMHGKDITIPKGTEVTAFVQGDMKLDMAKLSAPIPGVLPASASPAEAQSSSLTIDSPIPGADIEIDGNFVGNTPSTVSLTPGQHHHRQKKGYTDWTRPMTVSGTGVHVTADLEKATGGN